MKTIILATVGLLTLAYPALAQRNATTLGSETTAGNGAGAPSASTPAGQVTTTGGPSASPGAISAFSASSGQRAPIATADSTTTGTTAK